MCSLSFYPASPLTCDDSGISVVNDTRLRRSVPVVNAVHNSLLDSAEPSAAGAADPLDEAFGLLVARLDDAPLSQMQAYFRRWRGRMEAAEGRRLAARVGADGNLSAACHAAGAKGRRSKVAAQRAAARAAAMKENPQLGEQLESGKLSAEQLDSITHAMSTDPAAAHDRELLEAVAASSVDQGRRLARRWAANAASPDEAQSEHDRQRSERRATSYDDATLGLSVLRLTGDRSTIHELWSTIQAEARRLYETDGGRTVAGVDHARTRDQRLFDAAVRVLSAEPSLSGNPRPSIVVNIPAEKLLGADVCAELIGSGPLPDSVLTDLLERAEVWLQITSARGQPLWLGRSSRTVNRGQLISLAVRDHGCVLCGARWNDCEAHHLLPWMAPAHGQTDIDNLALLCVGCHHRLHANRNTLVADPTTGTWHTRPARPEELPPPPPPRTGSPRHRGRRQGRGRTSRPQRTGAAGNGGNDDPA